MTTSRRLPGLPLLAGSTWFNIGSGCYAITLGKSLFDGTGSVLAFAGVIAIEYGAPIVLATIAGSLSDRDNPARMCAATALLAAVATAVYSLCQTQGAASGIALGVALNLIRPFYRAGIFAAGPRAVAAEELRSYNAAWTVSVQAGQIVGGAAAGAILAFMGASWAFAFAAASFLLSFVSMSVGAHLIRPVPSSPQEDTVGWGSLLKDACGSGRNIISLLLIGVDFVTISVFVLTLAPLVAHIFVNSVWLGILDALFAAGSLGAVIIIRRWSSLPLRALVTGGYAAQVLAMSLLIGAWWVNPIGGAVIVTVGCCLLGAGVAVSSSQQVTLLQNMVSQRVVGRAGALRQAVIGIATALLLPIAGVLVDHFLPLGYLLVVATLLISIIANRWLSAPVSVPDSPARSGCVNGT